MDGRIVDDGVAINTDCLVNHESAASTASGKDLRHSGQLMRTRALDEASRSIGDIQIGSDALGPARGGWSGRAAL